MLTGSLLAVLLLAKALVLPWAGAHWTAWSPLVWFGQDLLVAGGFYFVERYLHRAVNLAAYVLLALYTAVNGTSVPIAR